MQERRTRGEVRGQGQQPEVIDTRILQSRNTKKEEQDKEVEARGRSKGGPGTDIRLEVEEKKN